MGFRSYFDSSSSGGGGGTPGGVNGDLQYNNAGAFGGLTPGAGVTTLLAGTPSGTGGLAGTTSPTFTTGINGNGGGSGFTIAASGTNDDLQVKGNGTGVLALLNAGTALADNSPFAFKVAADLNNAATTALYLYPRDSTAHRVFFGISGRTIFSMDFTNVGNVVGFPQFQSSVSISTTNTVAIGVSNSLTGSNSSVTLGLSPTWNTSGAPSLIRADVTNTGSGAASMLVDLLVGGVHTFQVTKFGLVGIGAGTPNIPTYGIHGAWTSGLTANQTMLVQDATLVTGSTGIFFNAGVAQSGNPVLTVQGSNSIQAAGTIKGTLTTLANAVTGLVAGALAALTNASLVITDGAGTVYRIPCVTP